MQFAVYVQITKIIKIIIFVVVKLQNQHDDFFSKFDNELTFFSTITFSLIVLIAMLTKHKATIPLSSGKLENKEKKTIKKNSIPTLLKDEDVEKPNSGKVITNR